MPLPLNTSTESPSSSAAKNPVSVPVAPSDAYCLRAAAPFEIYHCKQAANGRRERIHTDAYVPLEPMKRTK